MTAFTIRQWCSTSRASEDQAEDGNASRITQPSLATEVVRAPNDAKNLKRALVRASTEQATAFLILGLEDLTPDVLQLVLDGRHGHPRLTLAADLATLEQFASRISDDRIGLMLDDVGAETPLSSILWDHLEAIRFSHAFVARAVGDLRTSCALECTLRLARDLGLCTFGPSGGPKLRPGDRSFDYLPHSSPRSVAVSTLRTKNVSLQGVSKYRPCSPR